jgi:hypothetical protein
MSCIYENCGKMGIYENFTLCRTHKNFNKKIINDYCSEIPDRNAPPIPIYCKKCDDTTNTLNCIKGYNGFENCKKRTHLCENCDECVCDMDKIQNSYYVECKCFRLCPGCINTIKCWN